MTARLGGDQAVTAAPEVDAWLAGDDEIPEPVADWLDGDRLVAFLEQRADTDPPAEISSHVVSLELDGTAHVVSGFVTVDGEPFLGSDSPALLRELAEQCRELAEQLERGASS